MRNLFFALSFKNTKNIEFILEQLQSQLSCNKIIWTNPQKLHLTIKYLGKTKEDYVPEIIKIANEIANEISVFNIEAKNINIFGSSYNPRVIWVGLLPNENINLLNKKIEDRLINIGFLTDRQNFIPHLTLGRINKLTDKKQFQKIIQSFDSRLLLFEQINSFSLIESFPQKKTSPIYKIIANFNLSKKISIH